MGVVSLCAVELVVVVVVVVTVCGSGGRGKDAIGFHSFHSPLSVDF